MENVPLFDNRRYTDKLIVCFPLICQDMSGNTKCWSASNFIALNYSQAYFRRLQAQPSVKIPALETQYAWYVICPCHYVLVLKTDSPIPEGWTKYVHPDGCPYWYDTKRLEPDVELVVETVKYDWDEDYRCGYYFVHHKSRSLFWLQEFDVSYALWDAQANTSLSHVSNIGNFSATTGSHGRPSERANKYSDHRSCWYGTSAAGKDVHSCSTDLQTSDTSNALFSADELQSFLGAIKISRREFNQFQVHASLSDSAQGSSTHLAKDPLSSLVSDLQRMDSRYPYTPGYPGRLMSFTVSLLTNLVFVCSRFLVRQRFANFWGEYGARLHREQSVHHPDGRPRTWLITLLSPILFNAPDIHLRGLHLIFIDESAVLLAANVAFLAIQSVDNVKDDPRRSPSQIASYLSTLTSVSSMIVGLLLVRQTRTKGRDTAKAAADYLRARQYRVVGHEPLAIMYSLPYAFLMWA
ncbi:Vacuolar protein sorting-associated protein [Salix suchowensis]|nr:Vacuolar protein sorting-associated protein [Salix suchowensis]